MQIVTYTASLMELLRRALNYNGALVRTVVIEKSKLTPAVSPDILNQIRQTIYTMPHVLNMGGELTKYVQCTSELKQTILALSRLETYPLNSTKEEQLALLTKIFGSIYCDDKAKNFINAIYYVGILAIYVSALDIITLIYFTLYLIGKEV